MIQYQNEIYRLIENAPSLPGVYKFLNSENQVIYIGKAKDLKKRLLSYTRPDLIRRTALMIELSSIVEYVVTDSETDALLLEAQLVKKFQPKFNILLKDDKSFPYIQLRLDHDFPQIVKYRGKNLTNGKFFGPFASSDLVDTSLLELQKIFKLRPCSDNYFKARKRPCLQYQIGRCHAPCVGKISKENYHELVSEIEIFFKGNNKQLQHVLSEKMSKLSEEMRFEEAIEIRERIKALSYVQLKSETEANSIKNADIIAIARKDEHYSIQVFLYRSGQSCGNAAYFPLHTEDSSESEVLASFLAQFYQTRVAPDEIILNHKVNQPGLIEDMIKKLHGTKTKVVINPRLARARLVRNAYANALLSLNGHLKTSAKNHLLLEKASELFGLTKDLERIEIYDNSHIMGAFAIGAMVVATPLGFDKKEYRMFSIKTTDKGDDFSMLREVLTRRFSRLEKEPHKAPDLMIIDGGRGHMSVVMEVMEKFAIKLPFVCMSKGIHRDAGREQFHMIGKQAFTLDSKDALMKYLQILRDEAHNFAIRAHRKKRSKAIKISSLDEIPGIGTKRKKALLNYFGSYNAISSASIDEISKVDGISKELASTIFNHKRYRERA